MAPLTWTLRVYWKRYTFAAVASVLVAKYAAKKFRDNNTVRAYCKQAMKYGEERVSQVKGDGKPGGMRRVMVFLNPTANKRDAKTQFMKYSAPLFFLSGVDITIVESQREGHIRLLMNYVDPQIDCIVVAGGDGTLMEVFTGLMRRTDSEKVRSIPIGVIPLGKENQFYKTNLLSTSFKPPVRVIGDATMDIIRGDETRPLHLMEIRPETGRLFYALSSLQWGPLRDAYENRDGFRLFGKLRLLFSHLNVVLRRWPTDYILHIWHPRHCKLEEDSGTPPPINSNDRGHPAQNTPTDPNSLTQRTDSIFKRPIVPVVNCIRPQYGGTRERDDENKSSTSSDHFELTKLAEADLEYKELTVMGFHLSLCGREDGSDDGTVLQLSTWKDGSIRKTDFIKQGWLKSLGRSPASLPSLSLSSPHLVLQPYSHTESWVSIDGEVFDTLPISVTAIPNAFRVFTRKAA